MGGMYKILQVGQDVFPLWSLSKYDCVQDYQRQQQFPIQNQLFDPTSSPIPCEMQCMVQVSFMPLHSVEHFPLVADELLTTSQQLDMQYVQLYSPPSTQLQQLEGHEQHFLAFSQWYFPQSTPLSSRQKEIPATMPNTTSTATTMINKSLFTFNFLEVVDYLPPKVPSDSLSRSWSNRGTLMSDVVLVLFPKESDSSLTEAPRKLLKLVISSILMVPSSKKALMICVNMSVDSFAFFSTILAINSWLVSANLSLFSQFLIDSTSKITYFILVMRSSLRVLLLLLMFSGWKSRLQSASLRPASFTNMLEAVRSILSLIFSLSLRILSKNSRRFSRKEILTTLRSSFSMSLKSEKQLSAARSRYTQWWMR